MNHKFWNLHGARLAWFALLGLALVLAVLALRGFSQGQQLETRVHAVADQLDPVKDEAVATDDELEQVHGGRDRGRRASGTVTPASAAADRVTERRLFMPPPRQGFRDVSGVLGDRVLYPGGRSFGVGDDAMGATITAIGTNWVELQHDGETITLDIFDASSRGPELIRIENDVVESEASSDNEDQAQSRERRPGRDGDRARRFSREGPRGERPPTPR